MTSLSFRASLSLLAATVLFFGPGPSLSAFEIPCLSGVPTTPGFDAAHSTTCAPLTTCPNCPGATLDVCAVVPPRDLGPRFNEIIVDKFPVGIGTLQRAELTFTIQPGLCEYKVENRGTTSCSILNAASNRYDVAGFLDVRDPTLPGQFFGTTSDKVDGLLGSTGCIKWRVFENDIISAIGVTPQLPPWDGCYDYNDPDQPLLLNPSGQPNTCSPAAHGGPCFAFRDPAPAGTCTPVQNLGGQRLRMGRIIPGDPPGSLCGSPPFATRSGFTDKRVFTSADAYQFKVCITEDARLAYFRQVVAGPATTPIPLFTQASLVFPSWSCASLDQSARMQLGVRVDIRYFYCPVPPTCNPETADVCRAVGSTTLINVLANDSSTAAANCAAMTGTSNVTQGTYGTVQWVNDASLVNGLCNQKGIRYTLTTLPPTGVTTDTFNYTLVDVNGCTVTCPVTVRICSPVCAPDTGTVCRTVGATGLVNVLANDSNPCATALNCAGLTGTAGLTNGTYGTVAWVTDASLTNGLCNQKGIRYTLTSLPPAGVFTDTFNYTITSANGCTSTCSVTVTICSPVCQPDTGRVCRSVSSTTLVNVLTNDADNCGLNCAALTGTTNVTQGTYGSVQWVTDASLTNTLCRQRGIRYTLTSLPPAGVFTDTFNYTIVDTNGCVATCPVTITICSPTCAPDTGTVCRTTSSTTLINVLSNDTANCLANCAAMTGTTNVTQGTYGSVTWATDASLTNSLCAQKGVRYTLTSIPPAGVFTDTFNYTLVDANGCLATCPVTVTICSPVCQPDTGNACRTVGYVVPVNVFANDSDNCVVNCAALTGTTGISQGSFGTAAWVTNAAFTNSVCSQKGIHYTLNTLPPSNPATDTFSYTYTDSNGCSATCQVTITIASPTCAPDTADICRTTGQTVDVNVLSNDTSPRPLNCAALTGTTGLTNGAFGTVAWVTSAGLGNTLCNQKGIRYTLNSLPPATCSTDTFSYTITDTNGCTSTCTVTVTIASPTCASDCFDVCSTIGYTTTVNVLANDSSCRPLNCALLTGTTGLTQGTYGSVAWVSDGACSNSLCTGKCVRYTVTSIPPGAIVQDTFSYTITDTNGCTSTCTVQVRFCKLDAVNDGPIDACQGVPARVCVLDNDTSTCGALSCSNLSLVTPPANGIVQFMSDCSTLPTSCQTAGSNCSGCCAVYTPNTGFFGTDTFTYRVTTNSTGCPGGTPITCVDTATVTIVVKPAPDALDDFYELDNNGQVVGFDVRDNDSPGTGCELTGCGGPCVYVGCPEVIQAPTHGTLVLGPDCKFTYTATPGVPFPGSDTFCYRIRNNCGCCDVACVTIGECPIINRLLPGSLLLYPEWDNRPGRTTYMSITNANCQWPNAGTWVEFVYIDKTNCIEFNTTKYLTPCDTLTVLTSAQNPSTSRGYMYAFAKDVNGHPISFNHLIGDLIIADGVDGYQYAVNAVSFRSPVPRNQLTDLDQDGIRDLNGLEYDMAPDELMIPRFLGQDPPGAQVYQDELVILNLSGGLSFQTVISIIGYNDNEVPFSVTKQFYCWEKWKLSEISNAFTNTYLKGLGDDPLEIIGLTTREAGWFKIDGSTAFSDIEQITDPAIYGFLVEKSTNPDRAAELPWEICAQGNGDLLPKNPFGDGPVPVNGDNQ